jgi:hypothetical protein
MYETACCLDEVRFSAKCCCRIFRFEHRILADGICATKNASWAGGRPVCSARRASNHVMKLHRSHSLIVNLTVNIQVLYGRISSPSSNGTRLTVREGRLTQQAPPFFNRLDGSDLSRSIHRHSPSAVAQPSSSYRTLRLVPYRTLLLVPYRTWWLGITDERIAVSLSLNPTVVTAYSIRRITIHHATLCLSQNLAPCAGSAARVAEAFRGCLRYAHNVRRSYSFY